MSEHEDLLSIATLGMAATLGITIVELGERGVVATMPVDGRTQQPFGLLHGGASIALAETVASIGALSRIDYQRQMAVGQEINGNHVRGKSSGVVTAHATPLHLGRTSHVWSVDIRDEEQRLICVSRCTLAIVDRVDRASGRASGSALTGGVNSDLGDHSDP